MNVIRLYLVRGLVAIAWAIGFAAVSGSLAAGTVVLLVIYPLIDAISLLIDLRARPRAPGRTLQVFNIAVSTLTAFGLAIAGNVGVAEVLLVFGGWAVVAGVAQLVGALSRRRPEMNKQWSLVVAGSLSVVAGVVFTVMAFGQDPVLDDIAMYATGGGAFFVIQAGLLAWRLRKSHPSTT
jgi:hypothetical protein